MAGEFSLSSLLCIESTIWRPKSVPIKRTAKTIILHSCDLEICKDTLTTIVERGEIQGKERTYCVAGAPNDVSYKKNTHIPSIFIYYFLMDVAVWPIWMRFDRCHREDFTLQCHRPSVPYRLRRRLLRTHTTSQIRGR